MVDICIAIISGGTIKVDTVSCLMSAITTLQHPKNLYMPVGGYAAYNRNMSAKQALKHKASHLMFIDNDMVFPPDGIDKLLAHDKDIVLANYNARGVANNDHGVPTLASTIKIGENGDYKEINADELPKDKLFEVAAGGTGFMLIKTDVFNHIPYPWFVASEDGHEWSTEDVYFCEQARKNGYKIWCDPAIKLGHLGEYKY